MTLWIGTKFGLSPLWSLAAKAFRHMLVRPIRGRRNRDMEAYLLHPRCCRTEHYFEEHT
jgi:hypothetical protein